MSKQPRFQTAVKWAFVMSWGPSAIGSLLTFVLAMYLGKHDYGLVAMAALYIQFNRLFIEGGLGSAIVQRKNLTNDHLNSVFWITVGMSVLLMCLTWVLSPAWVWANGAFNSGQNNNLELLQRVINVLAFVMPIQGLTIVQQSLLEKNLDFKSLAIRSNVSALAGGLFGVALAVKGAGVWALVGEDLLGAVIRLALLWRLGQWRPSMRFSWPHFKELLGFSVHIMIGQIGTFAQRRSDAILIGMFFGASAVGLYRLADRLTNMVIEMATRPFVLVVLPNFSRLQDNLVELRQSLSNCLRASTMMTMPLLATIASLAWHICGTLSARGKDWDDAETVIQVLTLVGCARAMTLFTSPLVQSTNRTKLFMKMSWGLATLNVVGFCTAGYLLRNVNDPRWQALGVAITRAAVFCLIYTPLCLTILTRVCEMGWGQVFRSILPATLTAAVVFAVGVGMDHALRQLHSLDYGLWPRLARLCMGGAVTMSVALFLMFLLEPRVREFALSRFRKKPSNAESMVMSSPTPSAT